MLGDMGGLGGRGGQVGGCVALLDCLQGQEQGPIGLPNVITFESGAALLCRLLRVMPEF